MVTLTYILEGQSLQIWNKNPPFSYAEYTTEAIKPIEFNKVPHNKLATEHQQYMMTPYNNTEVIDFVSCELWELKICLWNSLNKH